MTNLDSVLKSRGITSPTKIYIVKATVFPVVVYMESWTIKKPKCKIEKKNDAFELWYWRRLLRVPSTARRVKQSILKEINTEYSWCWSRSSNTSATWNKEPAHWKRPWCWERLNAGGEGNDRGQVGWMASLTQWTWVWAGSGRWWWTGKPGVLQSMAWQSRTRLTGWTSLWRAFFLGDKGVNTTDNKVK